MNKIAPKMATKLLAMLRKHQSPSTKYQKYSNSNDRNGFVSEFGHLVIGNYLEFGIWYLEFQPCSGYTGLVAKNLI